MKKLNSFPEGLDPKFVSFFHSDGKVSMYVISTTSWIVDTYMWRTLSIHIATEIDSSAFVYMEGPQEKVYPIHWRSKLTRVGVITITVV